MAFPPHVPLYDCVIPNMLCYGNCLHCSGPATELEGVVMPDDNLKRIIFEFKYGTITLDVYCIEAMNVTLPSVKGGSIAVELKLVGQSDYRSNAVNFQSIPSQAEPQPDSEAPSIGEPLPIVGYSEPDPFAD